MDKASIAFFIHPDMTILMLHAFASKNIYLSCSMHTFILMRMSMTSSDWSVYYIVRLFFFIFHVLTESALFMSKGLRKLNSKLSWYHKTWLCEVRKLESDTRLLWISCVRRFEVGPVFPPQKCCWDTKVPLLSSSIHNGGADPQLWVSWVIHHLSPYQFFMSLLQECLKLVSQLCEWTRPTAVG